MPYKALDSLVDALSNYLKRLPTRRGRGAPAPRSAAALARLPGAAPGRSRRRGAAPRRRDTRLAGAAAARRSARCGSCWPARRPPAARALHRRSPVGRRRQRGAALRAPAAARSAGPAPHRLYRSEDAASQPSRARRLRTLSAPQPPRARRFASAVSRSSRRRRRRTGARPARGAHGPQESSAEAVARESRGNPLFIDELARVVRSTCDASGTRSARRDVRGPPGVRRGPAATTSSGSGSPGFQTTAHRLLATIAIAGRPLDRAARAPRRRASDEDQPALAVLRAGHLVRAAGARDGEDQVEIYHDRIRETIVARLTPQRAETCTSGWPSPSRPRRRPTPRASRCTTRPPAPTTRRRLRR